MDQHHSFSEHQPIAQKIALVHDWLPLIGGAERVLEQLVKVCPNSEIFTAFDFLTDEEKRMFGDSPIHASRLNRWIGVKRYYRSLLPLCARTIERFDVRGFDAVVSSSASFAKGVITAPDQPHIGYVHSPPRYAWDLMHEYLERTGLDRGLKGMITREILHQFRIWDLRTAHGVDHFIANSGFIAKRIWKTYRRQAEVVYPPVDVGDFTMREDKEDFYITASRLVPYKRVDLVVEAFAAMPDKRLIVIGDGPDMKLIKKKAKKNIELLGHVPRATLIDHLQRARAFVFAALEDFGITPVEAQACGTPVIAFGQGGALETVRSVGYDRAPTGIHFPEQTAASIIDAVLHFESREFEVTPHFCRMNAERFGPDVFRARMAEIVSLALAGRLEQPA